MLESMSSAIRRMLRSAVSASGPTMIKVSAIMHPQAPARLGSRRNLAVFEISLRSLDYDDH